MQDGESLSDLGTQGIGGLQEVKELGVVHLQQHAGDLASEFGLGTVDQGRLVYGHHDLDTVKLTERSSCRGPRRASASAPWVWHSQVQQPTTQVLQGRQGEGEVALELGCGEVGWP